MDADLIASVAECLRTLHCRMERVSKLNGWHGYEMTLTSRGVLTVYFEVSPGHNSYAECDEWMSVVGLDSFLSSLNAN